VLAPLNRVDLTNDDSANRANGGLPIIAYGEFLMTMQLHTLTPLLTAAIAAALGGATSARADVPPVDSIGQPATVVCQTLPGGAQVPAAHMDKIIFHITDVLAAANPADQAALNAVPRNTRLDIKVLDDPRTVADLKGKVLTFLGAVPNAVDRNYTTIDEVEYAVICPSPNWTGGSPN
jgi:hypothetical protein